MKSARNIYLLLTGILGILLVLGFVIINRGKNMDEPKNSSTTMTITSPAFKDGSQIPAQYTCKGEGINPPLNITGVPAAAKSLALIVHDPDAPGGDYVHWLAWDISASTMNINANSVPVGAIQGANSSGQNKYMGPCPPSGTHHYMFEFFALDKSLGLKTGSNRAELESAMQGHILAQASLTALFSAN